MKRLVRISQLNIGAMIGLAFLAGCASLNADADNSRSAQRTLSSEDKARCAAAEEGHRRMQEHDMEGTEMEKTMMKEHGRLCHGAR